MGGAPLPEIIPPQPPGHRPPRPPVQRLLATGILTNAFTTLYTVPARAKATVRFAGFFNTAATTETVEVKIQATGGTARNVARAVLYQNEQLRALDQGDELNLDAGTVVQGKSTNNSATEYVLSGLEFLFS